MTHIEDIWRLRGTKNELEELDIDTSGMASSVSGLRDEIQALSGVDIMLDSENYKSSYDILMDIGKVWKNLTDIDQARITELLFGKRQGNLGSAILQNYEMAEKVLEVSRNSAGSAEASNTASMYRNVHCKTYLIAGNSLEPCTTTYGKLYVMVLQRKDWMFMQRSS